MHSSVILLNTFRQSHVFHKLQLNPLSVKWKHIVKIQQFKTTQPSFVQFSCPFSNNCNSHLNIHSQIKTFIWAYGSNVKQYNREYGTPKGTQAILRCWPKEESQPLVLPRWPSLECRLNSYKHQIYFVVHSCNNYKVLYQFP